MCRKFNTHMRTTAIMSLVFVFASFTAWAAISHNDTNDGIILTNLNIAPQIPSGTPNHDLFVKKPPKDNGGGSKGPKTYSGSLTVNKGAGDWITLVKGKNRIEVLVVTGSLDAYMEEQGIDKVTITIDLVEQWVDTGDGTGHYCLDFTFGPSGAYFTPSALRLELGGKYVSSDTAVTLLDEYGEVLPSTSQGNGNFLYYYIPHFSSYSYDFYEY